MKIGLGQIDMGFEEPERAKALCRELLAGAGRDGVDFVVFPEMTLAGFTLRPETYGEQREGSPTIAFFREEARKNGTAICFGLPVHENGVSTNHSIILSKTGELLADYAKIHPFSYGAEARHYTGGSEIVSCLLDGVPISPFICYDLRFPEIFQIASRQSWLITVIANWPVSRIAHWKALLQARAIENQCFIVGVNRCGSGGGLDYSGDSMLFSPSGALVAHAAPGSSITVAEINPEDIPALRGKFPFKADRRPELYHALAAKPSGV